MLLGKGEKNYLEKLATELKTEEKYDSSYLVLYEDDHNHDLAMIFSSFHNWINGMFNYMNSRIEYGRFTADPSREAIELFKKLKVVLGVLNKQKIELDTYYGGLIKNINKFISSSYGSDIPKDFKMINIEEINPIFLMKNTLKVSNSSNVPLVKIGEGSYAEIFEYYDKFYDEFFIVKKAKEDLTEKELIRFKREFEVTKNLKSPFIIKPYTFNEENKEYIMEKADGTLSEYIEEFKLYGKKVKFIFQLIHVFDFIHTQKKYHRDISLNNILIKEYDGTFMIKISDFGLVKEFDSHLTSKNSEAKGTIIDPCLEERGFQNYDLENEIYSLTCIVAMIIIDENNINEVRKSDIPEIKQLLRKGCSLREEREFKNLNSLKEEALKLMKKLNIL